VELAEFLVGVVGGAFSSEVATAGHWVGLQRLW
jgi:hypothetical protein